MLRGGLVGLPVQFLGKVEPPVHGEIPVASDLRHKASPSDQPAASAEGTCVDLLSKKFFAQRIDGRFRNRSSGA